MIGSSAHNRVMSQEQRDAVEVWLREASRALLLADWRIVVEHEPPEDGCDAQIAAVDGHLHARVRVSAELLTESPCYVTATLAHELGHLHLTDVEHLAEEHLPDALKGVYSRASERVADQWGRLMEMYAPLPPIEPVLNTPRLPTE